VSLLSKGRGVAPADLEYLELIEPSSESDDLDMEEASLEEPVRYLRANRKLDIDLTLTLVNNN
jgi:hypothetical protein